VLRCIAPSQAATKAVAGEQKEGRKIFEANATAEVCWRQKTADREEHG
jgi:hypothetical protein